MTPSSRRTKSAAVVAARAVNEADSAVVKTIATQAATAAQASASARAVFEARVIVSLVLGRTDERVDDKLHALEMAYWRRADELGRAAASRTRSAPTKRSTGATRGRGAGSTAGSGSPPSPAQRPVSSTKRTTPSGVTNASPKSRRSEVDAMSAEPIGESMQAAGPGVKGERR